MNTLVIFLISFFFFYGEKICFKTNIFKVDRYSRTECVQTQMFHIWSGWVHLNTCEYMGIHFTILIQKVKLMLRPRQDQVKMLSPPR